jgi:ERCC4-type nuclease
VIHLDPRIGSADLEPLIRAASCPCMLTPLAFGDAWFVGNGPTGPSAFGIERKRLSDALACMHDGRLTGHQLPGMIKTYEHSFVIFEGLFRCDDDTGVMMTWAKGGWRPVQVGGRAYMYRDWDNWTTSLSLMYGVTIKYTSGPKNTARAVVNLYHYFHKSANVVYSAPPPMWAMGAGDHVMLRVAKEFDGIGWELSKDLAVKYGTLKRMFAEMSETSLREIHGIGKVKAARVMAELDKEFK